MKWICDFRRRYKVSIGFRPKAEADAFFMFRQSLSGNLMMQGQYKRTMLGLFFEWIRAVRTSSQLQVGLIDPIHTSYLTSQRFRNPLAQYDSVRDVLFKQGNQTIHSLNLFSSLEPGERVLLAREGLSIETPCRGGIKNGNLEGN